MLTVKSRAVASVRCANDLEISSAIRLPHNLEDLLPRHSSFTRGIGPGRRVGEPSKIAPPLPPRRETYPAFSRLTMRFMPALKRFSQKAWTWMKKGGRERNDLGNDLQFLCAQFRPLLLSFPSPQEDETRAAGDVLTISPIVYIFPHWWIVPRRYKRKPLL